MNGEHSSRAKKPEIVENGQKIYWVSSWAWVILTILMLTLGIRAWVKEPSTEKPPTPPTATAPAPKYGYAPKTEVVDIVPGYEYVAEYRGYRRISFTPKGGCVQITRPDGLQYMDCPGVNISNPPTAEGVFTIRAMDTPVRVIVVLEK